MNALSYDKLMQEQIEKRRGERLLLHCCCAPCASSCLERLKDDFKITVFFYNPNIPDEEYIRRKKELEKLISLTGWAEILDDEHNEKDFYGAVKGFEDCKEGGARCIKCFDLRLSKTFEAAQKNGFDLFTTTLTLSPLKDAAAINKFGEKIGGEKWLYSDFKKRDGYLRSIALSKQFGLYRQNFCGCEFSKREKVEIQPHGVL